MKQDKNLLKFIKSIKKTAPCNANITNISHDDNFKSEEAKKEINEQVKKLKYPYKPILIISLLKSIDDPKEAFNKEICILNNDRFIKMYYDLIFSSSVFSYFLEKYVKAKKQWFGVYNQVVKKQIISHVFELPASKINDAAPEYFEINKKNKTIKLNYPYNDYEYFYDYLLNYSFDVLKTCIPDYDGLSRDEIINYDTSIYQMIISSSDDDYKISNTRKFQHVFSKLVKDNDKKCIICCVENPAILEACHIKPYSMCNNQIERYDINNGITLCKNHHKLFDSGYFTFDEQWKVKISSKFKEDDYDLLMKEYEPCFSKIQNNKSICDSTLKYLKYHNEEIFIK